MLQKYSLPFLILPFIDDTPKDFKDLQDLDEPIKDFATKDIPDIVNKLKDPESEADLKVDCSPLTGAGLPNFFKEPSGDGKNQPMNVNLSVVLDDIDEDDKHKVVDDPDNPGKCTVDLPPSDDKPPFEDDDMKEPLLDRLEKELDAIKEEGDFDDFKVADASIGFFKGDQMWLNISTDIASIAKINWWPECAEEFKTRPRAWPPQDKVDELTEFCFVSKDPEGDDFNYDFQNIEEELAGMMSPEQKDIFMKYQAILNANDIDPDTDLGKTTMLRAMENFPPDDSLWQNQDIMLQNLFMDTLKSVVNGQLADFFIPAATTELDQGKKDKLVEIIGNVNKPLEELPIEEAVDFYKSVAAACEKMNTGENVLFNCLGQ